MRVLQGSQLTGAGCRLTSSHFAGLRNNDGAVSASSLKQKKIYVREKFSNRPFQMVCGGRRKISGFFAVIDKAFGYCELSGISIRKKQEIYT